MTNSKDLDITNLSPKERDRLLLNMASAMMDLTLTIGELIKSVDLLLSITMGPCKGEA